MRNRSTAAALVQALFTLVALIVLLAGVPAVLLGIGVLPDHVPGIDEITTALTSPDSGQLFLGAVTLIGWYGWLSFVVSVLLETGAALRHVRAPRVRMLGGSQQLASALVGGILILLPTGTAMATPAPATVATGSVTADTPAATSTATNSSSASAWDGPVHQVQDGDTLWDIAEQRLGAGIEWHRIVDVNEGVRQSDGSIVTADTTVLQPNWTLRLPADASPGPSAADGAQSQTTGSKAVAETHTVRAGETLSSIAQDELGDAEAYPRIVKANKGVKQDDGRALGDPDEIYPGWQLQIPTRAGTDNSDRSDSKPEEAQPPREQPADQGKGEARPSAEQPRPPAQDKPGPGADQGEMGDTAQKPGGQGTDKNRQDGGQPTSRPDAPAEQPAVQSPPPDREREQRGTPTQAPDAHESAEAADSGDLMSVRTIAAAGSILAAAVLAVIAARRARQQRRRRPKRRIPMPSGATADFEKKLRVAADVTGTVLADRALRTLAANCRQAGRPLPEVEAMRITARGIELHLAAPTPPVAPFTEPEANPCVWACTARGSALLDEEEAADLTVPYPALVSLGETEDGDAVLVNLEAIGLLRLAGSPADVRAVMLALAVELASSRLAPDTQVVLAGAGSDLHHLYPDQIEHHADLDPATARLKAHDAFQRQALADGGHDHLQSARLSEDGGDTWIPRVLIVTDPPTGSAATQIEDLLSSRPRTSVAVVTAAGGELDMPGAWTLPAQPDTVVELPDLNLAVKLQHLDADSYERLLQLIATSSRTDDVPPPAWTRRTGPADTNGPRPAAPGDEDSALAPEATAPARVSDTAAVQGSTLATAVPSFAALSPGIPPNDGGPAVQADAPQEDEDESDALSTAVTRPAGGHADHDANALVEPSSWDEESEPVEKDEETSGLGAEVWDRSEPDEDFETVLGQVMAEQEENAPSSSVEGDEKGCGLSSAALCEDLDVEEAPGAAQLSGDNEEGAESGASPAARGESAAGAAAASVRIVPRPSAANSTVLTALSAPPAEPVGPQVQVLGPVALAGTQGRVGSGRRNHLMEIAAWLVLHPGLGRQELNNAIWPGARKTAGARNTSVSRLRSWLGRDPLLPAEDPRGAYLPDVTDGVYQFGPAVSSDWGRFKELYQQGMHNDGQDADVALAHALALVRGRPFADIDPSKYIWAEADIQEMISAIVDVAHELAERRRNVRDYRAAAYAVTKGMLVDAQSELLYRDLFTICYEIGDGAGLERAAAQLARINAEEGVDSSAETIGLLRTLLKGERIQPTLGSAAS